MKGIHQCEAPGCERQLGSAHGMQTTIGGRKVRTCFGPCAQWATAESQRVTAPEVRA